MQVISINPYFELEQRAVIENSFSHVTPWSSLHLPIYYISYMFYWLYVQWMRNTALYLLILYVTVIALLVLTAKTEEMRLAEL